MLNYIKGEFYRIFNRGYFWVFTGAIAGFGLLMNILLKINHVHIQLTDIFGMGSQMLGVPVFLVIVFIDMVTAEEQKNLTMRNVISFGIPRSKFVLSKIIVTSILSFISALIIMLVIFGSQAVLFGLGSNFPGNIPNDLLRMAAAIPLWTGAIAVGTFLALFFNNSTAFAFVYAGTFIIISKVIAILEMLVSHKFSHLNNVLITTQLGYLTNKGITNHEIIFAATVGVIYTVIFTVISILYFERKEIK